MNKQEISEVLKDLYRISGFRVSLHGINYEEIDAYPKNKLTFCDYIQKNGQNEYEKCVACDSEACKRSIAAADSVIYRCRYGLVEAISPIYSFGALTGFIIMGQVKEAGRDTENLVKVLTALGKSPQDAERICKEIPEIDTSMVKTYVHIITICAKYLTISNALVREKLTVGQHIVKYIGENYSSHIQIKDICRELGYSKSTILSAFKQEFGTTINAYLTNYRLGVAKRQLEENELTINEIALGTGFADQSYFSKVFSAKYGTTPSEYRRLSVK